MDDFAGRMRDKKRKGAATADNVGSAAGASAVYVVGIRVIVEIVAEERGLLGTARDGWVVAVTENLEDVGVGTSVDFIRMALGVNQLLKASDHQRLHERTVVALMEAACESVLGPAGE